jgi:hypothetical protein
MKCVQYLLHLAYTQIFTLFKNQLHWYLDVCFGEDGCRARTNHAAENLNVLRKTALYLLRKTSVPEKRFGLSRKMLKATLRDDFLYDALFGKVK